MQGEDTRVLRGRISKRRGNVDWFLSKSRLLHHRLIQNTPGRKLNRRSLDTNEMNEDLQSRSHSKVQKITQVHSVVHSEDQRKIAQVNSQVDDHLFWRQLEWPANWNAFGREARVDFRESTRAHIPTSLLAVKCATETMHCEQAHAFSVTRHWAHDLLAWPRVSQNSLAEFNLICRYTGTQTVCYNAAHRTCSIAEHTAWYSLVYP